MEHVLYNALGLAYLAFARSALRRAAGARELVLLTALQVVLAPIAALAFGMAFGERIFGAIGLWAWGVFVHLPLLLLWGGARVRGAGRVAWPIALVVIAIGIDAFLIEPRWIEVSRHVIRTDEVTLPLRIVHLADVQTDDVGAYERRAIELALAEKPDLIVFAGDYVHVARGDVERLREQHAAWAELFDELAIDAPHGVVAVRGNCDGPGWESIFAGVPNATAEERTRSLVTGELRVTALGTQDSRDPELRVPELDRFHVVVGHYPEFALGDVEADLLLAGHCHGGQVRLPFWGPVMTLSAIPRAWTDGLHEIRPGVRLCVSRGVGLERVGAPRIRFLCRPEIVVIDLVPADADPG